MLKLTYSNLEFQIFPGEDPRTPLFKGRGGKGKEREERGEREGKEGGKDREGRGGTGRDRGGKEGRNGGCWGGEGREERSTWAPPPLETSCGSASCLCSVVVCVYITAGVGY